MRNVEIKAKIIDPNHTISLIKQLTDAECITIKQHDTFFKVTEGRLKLRQFDDGLGEVIYYRRSNTLGPKLCEYEKTLLNRDDCIGIKNILTASNGCVGIVKKTRKLYMVGQTRVHVDEVEGLGNYLELEVVLTDEENLEYGQQIAEDLMTKLNIKKEYLISEAYIDLMLRT